MEPVVSGASGIELIDNVLEELGRFIRKEAIQAHIVFDEFQEITELKNSPIEGVLRKHIQEHQASYFFVGSRRRTLLDIFNQKSRPFYQSAIMYPLRPLPHEDLVSFLVDGFSRGKKRCSKKIAGAISTMVSQYPYYTQALAYNVYEVSGNTVKSRDIETGFQNLIASERYGYEAIVQGLTGPQISLLKAIADDPASKILTADYMERHKLSVGGIQYARNKLERLDIIEKVDNVWRVVDPIFRVWLSMF